MFDITSSKLLLLGIVALLVIGPKDLPALLRTLGKYMGIVKRHAAEFRSQFDDAMRESELEQLKKDVETMGSETEAAMRSAEQSVNKEFAGAGQDVEALMGSDSKPAADPAAQPDALPPPASADTQETAAAVAPNGAHPVETPSETSTATASEPPSAPAKAGV